ncbi:hypothetical protein [Leucobacter sp. USHLN154]|uniref:hypothetical protein n=1 Tax=Leucobacter sp. USHLN154 TaxID=3081269 RepID=UPI0030177436
MAPQLRSRTDASQQQWFRRRGWCGRGALAAVVVAWVLILLSFSGSIRLPEGVVFGGFYGLMLAAIVLSIASYVQSERKRWVIFATVLAISLPCYPFVFLVLMWSFYAHGMYA